MHLKDSLSKLRRAVAHRPAAVWLGAVLRACSKAWTGCAGMLRSLPAAPKEDAGCGFERHQHREQPAAASEPPRSSKWWGAAISAVGTRSSLSLLACWRSTLVGPWFELAAAARSLYHCFGFSELLAPAGLAPQRARIPRAAVPCETAPSREERAGRDHRPRLDPPPTRRRWRGDGSRVRSTTTWSARPTATALRPICWTCPSDRSAWMLRPLRSPPKHDRVTGRPTTEGVRRRARCSTAPPKVLGATGTASGAKPSSRS